MKILVLNGSPKPISDTMVITNEFLKGIQDNSESEIEVIDIIKKKINPCMGCFKCWHRLDGKCIQNDDQNEILDKIIKSDIIIWSFPLYCYSMPSHMKAVLDRTIPFCKLNMKESNGKVEHEVLYDLSKKKYVIISGCGFPNWKDNFEGLRIQCRNFFGEEAIQIFVSETPMLNVKEAEPVTLPLKVKFYNAGKEYINTLNLSKGTIESLETPMIPMEVYINIVNGIANS